MLDLFCGTKKYRKRLFLITDGEADSGKNGVSDPSMIQLMQERDIRLNVITLDFANELGQDESDEDEEIENEDHVAVAKKKPNSMAAETLNQTKNKESLIDLVS